jgi:hypothetical protein
MGAVPFDDVYYLFSTPWYVLMPLIYPASKIDYDQAWN